MMTVWPQGQPFAYELITYALRRPLTHGDFLRLRCYKFIHLLANIIDLLGLCVIKVRLPSEVVVVPPNRGLILKSVAAIDF